MELEVTEATAAPETAAPVVESPAPVVESPAVATPVAASTPTAAQPVAGKPADAIPQGAGKSAEAANQAAAAQKPKEGEKKPGVAQAQAAVPSKPAGEMDFGKNPMMAIFAILATIFSGGKFNIEDMMNKIKGVDGKPADPAKPATAVAASGKPAVDPAKPAVSADIKPAEPAKPATAVVSATPAADSAPATAVASAKPEVSVPTQAELSGLGAVDPKSAIVIEARSYENTGVNGTPYTAVVSQPAEPALKVDAASGTSTVSLGGQNGAFNNKANPDPASVSLVDAKVEQVLAVKAQFDVSASAANQSQYKAAALG